MIRRTAKYWIEKLGLKKHTEGGWFKEIYRSEEIATKDSLPNGFSGDRNFSTSIYFLLEKDDISVLHRIKSDEIWHYYDGGSAIEIISLQGRRLLKQSLGRDNEKGEHLQIVVPKNTWFAARLINQESYALVACTVSPGFHFDDFEMANEDLLKDYPNLESDISYFLKR